LREENNFQVDEKELHQAITCRTKMIVLNTPNNPTGMILTRESLQIIANVAQKHNLLVISDEIYERIIYDSQHHAIASLPGMRERTITINGFSKAYAMTGWRLAYFTAQEELISPMLKIHQYVTTCVPTFIQVGVAKGMQHSNDDVKHMVREFERRRDFLVPALNSIPRLCCIEPQGAFYIFLNIKNLEISSQEAAKRLLYEAGVATVPGIAFGLAGEGNVRLSYATSYNNIVEAVERIKKAFIY
jgi:aminotransferase